MSAQHPANNSDAATEADRLASVLRRLQRAIDEADERIDQYAADIEAQKQYLWENRDEMDHIEKIAQRDSISQAVSSGDMVLARKQRLQKLQRSPYFGRFDFQRDTKTDAAMVYVGIHHFHDEIDGQTLVHDWRAPIASLFYDFEPGPAHYHSPEGEVSGELRKKRQFRIRDGHIELMLDTAVNVVDDILQETLGSASDEGMKNIVATIQRDQNAIIRNEHAPVLIIQGVAGSGKTSIALHRIAFLLYRFKDTLSSKDILIISPNSVFADYISNVLPELGEEPIREMRMEDLADELLGGEVRFQSFFEQTAALLEKEDEALRQRIRRKSGRDFLKQLDAYAAHVESERFAAEDVWIQGRLIPGWLIEDTFRNHAALARRDRLRRTVHDIDDKVRAQYYYEMTPDERTRLEATLAGMIREISPRKRYRQFYDWLGEPELFRTASNSRLEWADVYPLIYLVMKLDRVPTDYRAVRHLLVDEMQDYTAVQYAVLDRLFTCKKTILGDANQSINPYSASSGEQIRDQFLQSAFVRLNKSYRSSIEITQFAQRIVPNPDIDPVARHGPPPEVIACTTSKQQQQRIAAAVADFAASSHNTMGIVCRTQKLARRHADALAAAGYSAQLLHEQSKAFSTGVIVCTAHMAKGLEFDRVLVPDADAEHFRTPMDRSLLYVACTRAMHRLSITHVGTRTAFIPDDAVLIA